MFLILWFLKIKNTNGTPSKKGSSQCGCPLYLCRVQDTADRTMSMNHGPKPCGGLKSRPLSALIYVKQQLVEPLFKFLQSGVYALVFFKFLDIQLCKMYSHHAEYVF